MNVPGNRMEQLAELIKALVHLVDQLRENFQEDELEEFAASMREKTGTLQALPFPQTQSEGELREAEIIKRQ